MKEGFAGLQKKGLKPKGVQDGTECVIMQGKPEGQ